MDPDKLQRNFKRMSLCFSLNHGIVLALSALGACIALNDEYALILAFAPPATSSLGEKLGNLQNALLYSCYTITGLCFSSGIVWAVSDHTCNCRFWLELDQISAAGGV